MLLAPMRGRDSIRVAVVALLGVSGCAGKKSAPDAATPAAVEAPPPTYDVEQYARDLDAFESQLRAEGLELAGERAIAEPTPETATEATASGKTRCTRICDLATAICELEDRVCGLAQVHAGQIRYAEVCARARADCELATDACQECG